MVVLSTFSLPRLMGVVHHLRTGASHTNRDLSRFMQTVMYELMYQSRESRDLIQHLILLHESFGLVRLGAHPMQLLIAEGDRRMLCIIIQAQHLAR